MKIYKLIFKQFYILFKIKILNFLFFIFIYIYLKDKFIVSYKLKSMIIRSILRHFKFISYIRISFEKQINSSFSNCNYLRYIYITNSNDIPYKAFEKCKNLKIVFIGKKTKKIHTLAFSECSNLNIIFIPKNIEIIKSTAFNKCNKLTKVFFY